LNEKLFVARVQGSQELVGYAMTAGEGVLETDRANFSALEMVIFPMLRNHWLDMIPEPLALMQCNYPYRGAPYHYLAHYLDMKGDRDKAEKALRILERLEPLSYEWEYDLAAIYAEQDRKDDAVEHLRKAIARGAMQNETIKRDPRFLNLRQDPRFMELVDPATPPETPSKQGSR
jgi:tetratricopeptide (TPR) repeat protein